MKQKFKNYLKLGILLFGISAIVTGCLKDDDFSEAEVSQDEKSPFRVSLSDFKTSVSKNDDYQKLNKLFDINKNTISNKQNRQLQSEFSYTIVTNEILKVQKNDKTFYTFKLLVEPQTDEFYNLLVEVNEEQQIIKSEILEYSPTLEWLEDTSQPYTGYVSIYDNDIIDLNFNQRGFSRCVTGASGYWECDKGGNHEPNSCTLGTSWEYIIELQYGPCPAQEPKFFISDIEPGSGEGGGSGGGGQGGPVTGSPNPAPDNPNNPQAPSTTIGGDYTAPLLGEPLELETPCTSLTDLLKTDNLSANIKPVIQSLWNKRYENKEWYQQFEKKFISDNYKTYKQPGGIQEGISINECRIDTGGFIIGVIHLHPYKTQPMFSWQDLRSMRNLYNDATPFLRKDVFSIIVGIDGSVYALKINDYEAFNAKINSDWDTAKGNNERRKMGYLNRQIEKKYGDSSNLERTFLQEFENYGVSLYKATGNLLTPSSSNLSNFKKLELEDDSTSSNVLPVPCN